MTGIVFPTEEEAQPFLQNYERGRFDGLQEGETYHDDAVLVALTGVGKIKATLRTERLLQTFKPRRLIHAGTCTALNDELAVGTLVAASQVFEGDRIELAAPTYPRMPLDPFFDDLTPGTLVTQDYLGHGEEERSYWQRIADVSDMTGYAVAYVAATYGLPCHIVKVVASRLHVEDKQFRKTLAQAYQTLSDFLLSRLEQLAEAE